MSLRRPTARISAALLHLGLLLMVCAFIISPLTARYGYVHLRCGAGFAATWRSGDESTVSPLPFRLRLDSLRAEASQPEGVLAIGDGTAMRPAAFGPGHHIAAGPYRLLPRGIDAEGRGATFSVACDPLGRPLAYAGYCLLLVGLAGCLLASMPPRSSGHAAGQGRAHSRLTAALAAAGLGAALIWLAMRAVSLDAFPAADMRDTFALFATAAFAAALLGCRTAAIVRPAIAVAAVSTLAAILCPSGAATLSPVLRHPLLGLHVGLVMTAYALLAIASAAAISSALRPYRPMIKPALMHRLLLGAMLALAAGIATGSIWADGAWGRYWNWDPKESWALATMLIYALPLHRRLFRGRPRLYYAIIAAAFALVLFTWFGVSYLLPGLHSYI